MRCRVEDDSCIAKNSTVQGCGGTYPEHAQPAASARTSFFKGSVIRDVGYIGGRWHEVT